MVEVHASFGPGHFVPLQQKTASAQSKCLDGLQVAHLLPASLDQVQHVLIQGRGLGRVHHLGPRYVQPQLLGFGLDSSRTSSASIRINHRSVSTKMCVSSIAFSVRALTHTRIASGCPSSMICARLRRSSSEAAFSTRGSRASGNTMRWGCAAQAAWIRCMKVRGVRRSTDAIWRRSAIPSPLMCLGTQSNK